MTTFVWADGIFDWNEAVLRVAAIMAVPAAIVAIGFIIYAALKLRKR
jgi:hypothetical protein